MKPTFIVGREHDMLPLLTEKLAEIKDLRAKVKELHERLREVEMIDWNKCDQLCIPDIGRLVWFREADGNINLGRREAPSCGYDGWEWTIFRDRTYDARDWPGVTHWAYPVKPEPPKNGLENELD